MAPPTPGFLVRGSYRDLEEMAIAPSQFAWLSDEQYLRFPRLSPLTERKVVDWCWSYSLTHSRAVLVPAGLVYFSCGRRAPNDVLPEMISTGTACHVSVPQAVLAGLYEVLERDAVTIAWHNRLPLTALDSAATPVADLLAERLGDCGMHFQLFQVPTDAAPPVILATATSNECEPYVTVGAACRLDPIEAATKALYEACQVLASLRDRKTEHPTYMRRVEDHALFYATLQGGRLFHDNLVVGSRRFLKELPLASAGSDAVDLKLIVGMLADLGLEVIVHEVTTADVAGTGFRVVRVLVPGTIDMSVDTRFLKLGGHRFHDLPLRLGIRRRTLPKRQLNLLPLPLA